MTTPEVHELRLVVTAEDFDPASWVLPEYCATSDRAPSTAISAVQIAVSAETATAPHPVNVLPFSRKATWPPIGAAPGDTTETRAVKVSLLPCRIRVAFAVSETELEASPTVSERLPLEDVSAASDELNAAVSESVPAASKEVEQLASYGEEAERATAEQPEIVPEGVENATVPVGAGPPVAGVTVATSVSGCPTTGAVTVDESDVELE